MKTTKSLFQFKVPSIGRALDIALYGEAAVLAEEQAEERRMEIREAVAAAMPKAENEQANAVPCDGLTNAERSVLFAVVATGRAKGGAALGVEILPRVNGCFGCDAPGERAAKDALGALERRGLIDRQNGKRKGYSLTPSGKATVEHLARLIAEKKK